MASWWTGCPFNRTKKKQAEKDNSNSKAWEINNREDKEEPSSDSFMHELDKKHKVTETVFVTSFAVQSVAKLGMADTKEVTDHKGEVHAEFIKVTRCSFKSSNLGR